ncbi:MAG: hypothetical protein WCX27_01390 [Candidatus Paceibacterota bacterium]|jgi:hypothetical protein
MRPQNLTKKIALFIAVSILSTSSIFLLTPKKTNAFLGVGDVSVTSVVDISDPGTVAFYGTAGTALSSIAAAQAKQLYAPSIWDIARKEGIEPALSALAKDVARGLIQKIVESTVNWINTGFQGRPAFIADTDKFLLNSADQVVGEMLFNDPSLNFLCQPFQLQVKLALGLGYSNQQFSKNISCTLTGASQNIQNAVKSGVLVNASVNNTAWSEWLSLTEPQNEPIGAYLATKAELDSRIKAKQSAITAELSYGMGSLSYKKCDKVTYDAKGNVKSTEPFVGSPFYVETDVKAPFLKEGKDKTYTVIKNCTVKTPGSIITNMLGFKATSDLRTAELQAALGNGIDTVMQSLANEILKLAAEQLQEGVLGKGQATTDYKSALNNLSGQIQSTFNTQMENISTGQTNSTFNSYDSSFGTGYGAGFNQYTPPVQGANGLDPLSAQKGDAISRVNYLLGAEANFRETYLVASRILTEARAVFVTARTCNASFGDANSYLRSRLIQSNVITNIDGIMDFGRDLAQIPWNLMSNGNSIDLANAHITILNTAGTAVTAATSLTGITESMIPVTSTSFNIDPQTSTIENVRQWLRGVRNMYSTTRCPIDLTYALSISTSTVGSTVTSGSFSQATSTGN